MREWLKEMRCAAGLTMKQAGEKLDLTETYYCYIEKGARLKRMPLDLAVKLSDLFGVPVDEIIRHETQSEEEEE